jgi:hypothetical protein
LLLVEDALGLGEIDHDAPFHNSTSVWSFTSATLWYWPTAIQPETEKQAIPAKMLSVVDGLGLGTIDHVEPFHASISVRFMPSLYVPTAKQLDGPLQATPLRADWVPVVVGAEATDHAAPFHDSINCRVFVPLVYDPTAKQLDGRLQATPFNSLFWVGDVLGLESIDHVVAVVAEVGAARKSAPETVNSAASATRQRLLAGAVSNLDQTKLPIDSPISG